MLPIKSTNSLNVKMVSLVGQDRNFPSENRSSGAYPSRIEAVADVRGQWKIFHLTLKHHYMDSRKKNRHSKFNPCNKSHQKDWDKRYVWFVVLFFSENRSSHFRWTYQSPMLSDTNNFCKILIILMLMNDWIVKSRSACKIGPPFYVSEWWSHGPSIGSGAPGTQQKVLRN